VTRSGLAGSLSFLIAVGIAIAAGARAETAIQRALVVAVVAEVAARLAIIPWQAAFELEDPPPVEAAAAEAPAELVS
jgi:hypothetical protein